MGEAAPRAAGCLSAEEVRRGLGVLRKVYLDEFTFGYDPESDPVNPWWVITKGRIASLLRAPTDEAIGHLVEVTAGEDW